MKGPLQEKWLGEPSGSYSGPSPHMDTLLSIWPKVPLDTPILELGCNVGRQSYRLQTLGYTNLTRCDLNPQALNANAFPHLSEGILVDLEGEDWGVLESRTWDLVFNVAVLEHIWNPKVVEKVSALSRKWLCVCEDEEHTLETHQARGYQGEFEALGWTQVRSAQVPEDRSFWARVFSR